LAGVTAHAGDRIERLSAVRSGEFEAKRSPRPVRRQATGLRRDAATAEPNVAGVVGTLVGCGKSPPWPFSTKANLKKAKVFEVRNRHIQRRMTLSTGCWGPVVGWAIVFPLRSGPRPAAASMKRRTLDTICFTICIVSIVAGAVLSLAMIWLELQDEKILWKLWLTLAVLFFASAATLSVSKTLAWKSGDEQ
jgi:hypothetical protein